MRKASYRLEPNPFLPSAWHVINLCTEIGGRVADLDRETDSWKNDSCTLVLEIDWKDESPRQALAVARFVAHHQVRAVEFEEDREWAAVKMTW